VEDRILEFIVGLVLSLLCADDSVAFFPFAGSPHHPTWEKEKQKDKTSKALPPGAVVEPFLNAEKGFPAQRISFVFFWFPPMLRFPLASARNHHFPRRKDPGNWHERIGIIEEMNGVAIGIQRGGELMSAKARRILALMNDPRRRTRVLDSLNKSTLDNVGPIGGDKGEKFLSELNEMQDLANSP
jgi:hypothetical protein